VTGARGSCATCGCRAPARYYLVGWRCAEHGPPAVPVPDPNRTAAALLASRTSTSYTDAIKAEQERRQRIREQSRAR